MKKLSALILFLVLSSMIVTSCGGGGSTDGGNPKESPANKDITVIVSSIGNNMDPIEANYTDTSSMMYHVYDRIIKADDNFNIIPDVASEWSQPDNMTIEFTINTGYKFHNGEDMTMDDVVYSIERLRNIAKKASFMAGIEGVASEGNKLIVKLTEPNSGILRDFAEVIIVNKKYCEEAGDAYANAPIGTGPYKVKEFVPGDKLILEAWTEYPFEKAQLSTITFKGISEAAAKYIAVESGDAQFAAIDAKDKDRATENNKLTLEEKATAYTGFIAMNTTKEPFDNVNVRRAIAHAYDKEGIAALSPGRKAIDSMFPETLSTYYSSPHTLEYNLDKAKALLEAEGYNASNPLKFEAVIYSGSDPAMEAFQAQLRSINVEMTITNLEFGVFLEKMAGADYQLLSGGWGNTTGNPLSAFECYYTGSFGMNNIGFYSNERTDELYNIAKATTSEEEMIAAAKEVQDIAAQEVPIVPSISRLSYFAHVKELKDVEILTSGLISFRNASVMAE